MNFLFKVFVSCSEIPKAKLPLNRQTGCRQGGSHLALLLLCFVAYCDVAVLSLTKKQVLSPILSESSSFNHPPSVCKETLIIRLRCAGCVLSRSPSAGSSICTLTRAALVPPQWVPVQHIQADALGALGVLHFSHRHQAASVPFLLAGRWLLLGNIS